MGQGGSATSGRGLTGMQVAAALKVTAASQLQHHRERQAAAAAPATRSAAVRRTPSGLRTSLTVVDDAACAERRAQTVEAPAAGGTGQVQLRVVEYAPEVFRFLRAAEAIDEAVFAEEWTLPEERLRMELGEGRSQALFLKSKTMAFMCKTIARDEVDVLLSILRAYATHIVEQPNSLLMRFYMLLQVEVGKEVGYILCFNDVFGGATTLNEKWDIKGRVPKPGKFQYFPHLIREANEPDPYLITTPVDDRVTASERSDTDVVIVRAEADKHKVVTHKDKELTRMFWLEGPQREKVLNQLLADYSFLGTVGLMDYSLLIGVSYNESKQSRSGKRYVVIKNMKMVHVLGDEGAADAVEVRPSSPGGRQQRPPLSELADGVHSLFDQEVYYIGIIDMLTKYGGKKKAANFFKSFLWHSETLSTIPPGEYQKRISRFTKLIFPKVKTSGAS